MHFLSSPEDAVNAPLLVNQQILSALTSKYIWDSNTSLHFQCLQPDSLTHLLQFLISYHFLSEVSLPPYLQSQVITSRNAKWWKTLSTVWPYFSLLHLLLIVEFESPALEVDREA